MHTTPLYKPFHFIVTWYKDPSSKDIVTQAWKLKYPCYVQLNFHFNSIKLAKDFNQQNKHYFSYSGNRLNFFEDILCKVQSSLILSKDETYENFLL